MKMPVFDVDASKTGGISPGYRPDQRTFTKGESFMTAQILAHIPPLGNTPAPLTFDFLNEETPAVSSLDIAQHFQKKHQHVLRDIQTIIVQLPEMFVKSNFGQSFREVSTGNGTRRRFPIYLLSRDAFTILVMGFTGPAATRWKLRYIEAFNALEKAVKDNFAELAHQSGYAQGLAEGQSAPAVQIAAQKAYLAGLTEGQGEAERLKSAPEALLKLYPKRMQTLKASLRYARMGLSSREIAKLLDGNHRQIGHLLSLARKVGLLPPLASTMLPALPEVSYAG